MKDTPKSTLTLSPYLALSRDLSVLIAPVRMREEFRAQLYNSLLDHASQQRASVRLPPLSASEPTAGIPARFARWVIAVPGQDRRWVWGAAAVGSAVSLAGLMTYVWHRRANRAA
jgi:hypothetical protein